MAQLLLSESVEEEDSLPIRSQPPSDEPPAARLSGSCLEADDDDSFLRNSSFEQKLKQEVAAVVEGSMESGQYQKSFCRFRILFNNTQGARGIVAGP